MAKFAASEGDNESDIGETTINKTEQLCIENVVNCTLILAYIADCKKETQGNNILPCILEYIGSLQINNYAMNDIFFYSNRNSKWFNDELKNVKEKAFLRAVDYSLPMEGRKSNCIDNLLTYINGL